MTPTRAVLASSFGWISHTWDHENLDAISYNAMTTELSKNSMASDQFGLKPFTVATLVPPDISGLMSSNAMRSRWRRA